MFAAGILVAAVLWGELGGGGGAEPRISDESGALDTPPESPGDRLADSLEVAIARYRERATDFDAGRIGCDLLAAGYREADRAFVQLSAAREIPGGGEAEAGNDRYARLARDMDDVNRHYDSTGCPRPR
jgi:hypothetical protein